MFLLLFISLRKANGGHYYRWHQEYWLNSLDYISSITGNIHRTGGLLHGVNLCGCKPTSKYVASSYSLLSYNKQSYFQFVIVFRRKHQMVAFVVE